VFSDAADGRDSEFNEWYDTRHIPEILAGVPAFVAAQRFRCSEHQRSTAIPCPWRYLAIYELETDDLADAYSAMDTLRDAGQLTPHDGTLAPGNVAWTYTELWPQLAQTEEAAASKPTLGTKRHEFVILTDPTDGREDDFLRWYEAHIPEILDNYPGLTTGHLFRAAPQQRTGQAPDWRYLALYALEADDVAEYFAIEPRGLEGMTKPDGALAARPAQWVFTPLGPRATESSPTSVSAPAGV
jgi:hypothetical protein